MQHATKEEIAALSNEKLISHAESWVKLFGNMGQGETEPALLLAELAHRLDQLAEDAVVL